MMIDAHQHFWRIDRGDYGWLNNLPAINRDFLPEHLAPILNETGIDKTILVQCAETVAETQFMLNLANASPFIAGVVGWIDLTAPDATRQIATLAANPKVKGLRPMLQDMDDKSWILRGEITPALLALTKNGLRFDALIKPPHLPHMPAFAEKHAQLPIVIDHCAKPYIARGELEPWRTQMAAIARHKNVYCKLSGLITEAGESWSAETLKPYVDAIIDVFSPQRIMWGSDWPVCLLAGSYTQWRNAAQELTAHLSTADRAAIFGETAAQFYGLH